MWIFPPTTWVKQATSKENDYIKIYKGFRKTTKVFAMSVCWAIIVGLLYVKRTPKNTNDAVPPHFISDFWYFTK